MVYTLLANRIALGFEAFGTSRPLASPSTGTSWWLQRYSLRGCFFSENGHRAYKVDAGSMNLGAETLKPKPDPGLQCSGLFSQKRRQFDTDLISCL